MIVFIGLSFQVKFSISYLNVLRIIL